MEKPILDNKPSDNTLGRMTLIPFLEK